MTTTIVSGLGRCGSSLTMQMLAAGGMRVLGTFPDFEDPRADMRITPDLVRSMDGGAFKVLDPYRNTIPRHCDVRVVWLSRDFKEQAASQAKLLRLVAGLWVSATHQRKLIATLQRDQARSMAAMVDLPIMTVAFESILANPKRAAAELAHYIPELTDPEAAARAVIGRHSACHPGMAIEEHLLRLAA